MILKQKHATIGPRMEDKDHLTDYQYFFAINGIILSGFF